MYYELRGKTDFYEKIVWGQVPVMCMKIVFDVWNFQLKCFYTYRLDIEHC